MAEPDETSTAIPRRELRDPSALRALSHPVRLRILDELMVLGQATATELADRLGESPANCSWHLRQLAQHGFIEEAGGGTGRQRPWRIVVQSNVLTKWDDAEEAGEGADFAAARDGLVEVLMGREVAAWGAYQRARGQEPLEWQEAEFGVQSSGIWLTVEELTEIKRELMAVLDRLVWTRLARMEPHRRPVGSRPVRLVAWAVPAGPAHPARPEDAPAG